jgi:hypothetical protein
MESSVEFSDGQVFFDPGVRVVCREGLHADRGTENPGAEARLSFPLALSERRFADRAAATTSPARETTA